MAADLDGDWRRALREWDGDPAFYTRVACASRREILPWDHLDVGVRKAGLLREWERAGSRRAGARLPQGSEGLDAMARVRVGSIRDVPAGEGRVIDADGKSLALFNVDGRFYAIDNGCPHRGGPLGEGDLDGTLVHLPVARLALGRHDRRQRQQPRGQGRRASP